MMQLQQILVDEILAQALDEFPNECCGLIAGDHAEPAKLFRMKNADASPVTYRFDSREQLRVQNEIDENGWDILAIYHSHTHSEAYPSETDRRQAFYPDSYYLVLSVSDRENPVLRAFRIVEGAVAEEEVEIV